MATLDWPLGRAFEPRRFVFGARTPKSAFSGFFTGQTQSISHLGDRLRATVTLAKCEPVEAARREAFFMELASAGHWVRLGHLQRPEPIGTLRGAPTVAAPAAAGSRSITVQGVVGANLAGGDPLGVPGQLLLTGHAGVFANGAGQLVVPLVLPLRVSVAAGAAVTWQAPTTTFQLATAGLEFAYGRQAWQDEVELSFVEVY